MLNFKTRKSVLKLSEHKGTVYSSINTDKQPDCTPHAQPVKESIFLSLTQTSVAILFRKLGILEIKYDKLKFKNILIQKHDQYYLLISEPKTLHYLLSPTLQLCIKKRESRIENRLHPVNFGQFYTSYHVVVCRSVQTDQCQITPREIFTWCAFCQI